MMNDRFSAGLRQHLLDTANERPAGGQLAAVVERLAVTAQRPPLVARLAWFPGRIGPFPSTAVRWALIAAALLAATMAVAILGGGGGPSRSTVFEGTWTSTDPLDDSRQTLVVAAGVTPAVHFEDDLATGGACDFDEVKVFTAEGTGTVSGSLLAVSYPEGGGCGLMTVEIGPGFLEYDEATDTLTGSDGLTWFRVQEGGGQPTLLPAAEESLAATMAVAIFEGTWTSTDPGDESRQTLVVAAGMTPAVHFEDDFATGAACVDDPVKVFTADGTGQVSDSLLAVSYPDGGGCGLMTVEIGPGFLEYDEASDTLTDSDGLTWYRVPEGGGLPTQPPAAEESTAPPSIEPTPIIGCLEIPGGEYSFDVGGVVPLVTLSNSWHAVDNGFHHLENGACGSSGSMRLDLGLVSEVYADICRWIGTGVELGDPTTTTAFSAQGFETTRSTETTIAGFPAVRFDFSVPADFDLNACDAQTLRLWGAGPAMDPGLSVTVILLQVDGVPVGVAATRNADATKVERDTLAAIVTSLRIEP